MNKKQIFVTSLLLSLMLILIGVQGFFNDKFKQVDVIDNTEVNQYEDYAFNEEEFTISFPQNWNIESQDSKDEYISSVVKFEGNNKDVNGIIQVINTYEDIRNFADDDYKNQSIKSSDLQITPFNGTESTGVLLKYNTSIRNGYNFYNECYYIKINDGEIIKVLFNMKDKNPKMDNINDECSKIISSIRLNK